MIVMTDFELLDRCAHAAWGASTPDFRVAADHILEAAGHADLLAIARQYRDDLRHPPSADSITRRLAAIDAVLAKVTGE